MKFILRVLLYPILGLVGSIIIYLVSSWGLSKITTEEISYKNQNIKCFIRSNGVHTDLVLPRKNHLYDWDTIASPNNTKSKRTDYDYISFGWGDRGFYLETPTWSDLKVSTALKAGFGLSKTAMHTTYYKNLTTSERCIELSLSEEQYLSLSNYIRHSFKTINKETKHIVTNANYGNNDAFYEANGKYSIFKTCNTWANEGLKKAHISTAWWTPFDDGIFQHFQND